VLALIAGCENSTKVVSTGGSSEQMQDQDADRNSVPEEELAEE
jgi:hypothetical protein